MPLKALLFGAIGTLTETSELQRQAFNAAFAEVGLDWDWGPEAYFQMLHSPGGRDRVATYALAHGVSVDADAIHLAKVRHFERLVQIVGLTPRAGVTEMVEAAQATGVQVGFVTTTGNETVSLILNGIAGHIHAGDFAYLGDRSRVARAKPAPDIYLDALDELGLAPTDALAIEDTPESAKAAVAAGIPTIGFPGYAARGRAFPEGVRVVGHLTPDLLMEQAEPALLRG